MLLHSMTFELFIMLFVGGSVSRLEIIMLILICIIMHCSYSYYTVVARIFLVSTASCIAICGVASVRASHYSQPFWLK